MLNVRDAEVRGVEIRAPMVSRSEEILTPDALEFLAMLERRARARRRELLAARRERQLRFDRGELPGFLPETAAIRAADWTVAPLPADLLDRRVEITGPVDRKMVINALNSGARVFMADFEDSNSPTWENCVAGQVNLRDAVRGTIEYVDPRGKEYRLADRTATLMVRPRGWHLDEKHVRIDGEAVSASVFDFALFFFHNARELVDRGTGPYFYLPKLESHLEARLWNDLFLAAQSALGIPAGTIKATVLIETIVAAFEMDEILWELREHSAGLNCGRWDYIFSFIKKFAAHPVFVLPDRAEVTMTSHFLRSYSRLLIRTCHRRRVHAMGGMAAQIPIKDDPAANAAALGAVAADKVREATDGHDGTWVAHPGLIPVAMPIFDRAMPGANQFDRSPEEQISAADLLAVPTGRITRSGLRTNLRVALEYIAAWLSGNGCVPIAHKMEDAATAEISRTQVWQWVRHRAELEDGTPITRELALSMLDAEAVAVRARVGDVQYREGRYAAARRLTETLIIAEQCPEFLTLPGYELLH